MIRRALAPLAALAVLAAPAGAHAATNPYIVVLEQRVEHPAAVAEAQERRYETSGRTHVFDAALTGYAADVPEDEVQALRQDDRVAYVERDRKMSLAVTQTSPRWGLDRIDERKRPLDDAFQYSRTGAGVTAYVLDTGVRASHHEFGGRATTGPDFVGDGEAAAASGGGDCNGHGTHVAATLAGERYGVAKSATVVGVRVLDCLGNGRNSEVIDGIDWVTSDHSGNAPAVANLSLGGLQSRAVDDAVKGSIGDGVSYAIAAGNGGGVGLGGDACDNSPARVGKAMTTAAVNRDDRKPSWSNYGRCVDWFAPGVDVKSAWSDSDSATKRVDGTSMAAPHSAGVAAQYLEGHPSASPAKVLDAVYARTTRGVVRSAQTPHDHLLFTGF